MTTKPISPPENGQPDNPTQRSTTLSSIHELRLAQDQIDLAHGAPVTTIVPVDKPPRAHFFRVRSGVEFTATLVLLDARKTGGGEGMYAVTPQVAPLVADQTRLVQLRLAVTSFGAPYMLPVPLPGPDGRSNPWHQSLAAAGKRAESTWVRISPDMRRGQYNGFEALGQLGEPQWPGKSLTSCWRLHSATVSSSRMIIRSSSSSWGKRDHACVQGRRLVRRF